MATDFEQGINDISLTIEYWRIPLIPPELNAGIFQCLHKLMAEFTRTANVQGIEGLSPLLLVTCAWQLPAASTVQVLDVPLVVLLTVRDCPSSTQPTFTSTVYESPAVGVEGMDTVAFVVGLTRDHYFWKYQFFTRRVVAQGLRN